MWRWLAVLFALAVMGGLVLGAAALPEPWASRLEQASWASAILALVTIPLAMIAWATQSRRNLRIPPTSEEIKHAKRALAHAVTVQWQTEAKYQHLFDPAPISVRWRISQRPVSDHHSHIFGDGRAKISARTDRVAYFASKFARLPKQRLVIIGDPGSGKTSFAILLTLELLKRAGSDNGPIPVILSLSDWDPDGEDYRSWVARKLSETYPTLRSVEFGNDCPTFLMDCGEILPVLDGLDQLSMEHRRVALRALNQSLGETDGVILTSRATDYQELIEQSNNVISSALVLESEPVGRAEALAYLKACLPPTLNSEWQRFFNQEETMGASASNSLSTPLNLWLIRSVCIESAAGPDVLARHETQDSEELTAFLFSRFVASIFSTQPHVHRKLTLRKDWDRHSSEKWLAFLADHLHKLDTYDISWWRISECWSFRRHGLIFACSIGPIFTALWIVLTRQIWMGALVAALMIILAFSHRPSIEPAAGEYRWRDFLGVLLNRMRTVAPSLCVLCGLGCAIIAWIADGGVTAFIMGLVGGVLVAILLTTFEAFVKWSANVTSPPIAATPMSSLRADRRLTLFSPLLLSFALGASFLALGAVAETWSINRAAFGGPVEGLLVGAALGATFGFMGRLFSRPWPRWMVAKVTFAISGRLPWALMTFLEDMHKLGILRRVGSTYQFRHAVLQDRLSQP